MAIWQSNHPGSTLRAAYALHVQGDVNAHLMEFLARAFILPIAAVQQTQVARPHPMCNRAIGQFYRFPRQRSAVADAGSSAVAPHVALCHA